MLHLIWLVSVQNKHELLSNGSALLQGDIRVKRPNIDLRWIYPGRDERRNARLPSLSDAGMGMWRKAVSERMGVAVAVKGRVC